jgi:hypothetical protein
MLAAFSLFLAMQAAQPVVFLPAVPPLAEWENVQGLTQIRANAIVSEDMLPVMEIMEQKHECRSVVGAMPSPRDEPNIRMVGFYLDVLVLVMPDGRFSRIVAAPGPCDDVRNYARALVNGRFTQVLARPEGTSPAWYRARLVFAWQP